MADKNAKPASKSGKGIPVPSKIPTSGQDSGTHSRSSSVSNLTSASDLHSEAGDVDNTHGFKVDERIWVNGTKPGVIKFLGKTEFAPGVWAGILLDESAGKNDGSVNGVKYFTCEPQKGIFARPQKLTRSFCPSANAGDSTPLRASTPLRCTTPSNKTQPVSTPTSSSRTCSRLRLGERIAVSSTAGNKNGTLRFLGETEFAKGEWAGIELDEPVGKNDGSVAGKRYFQCPLKFGLFAPIHKVSRAGGTGTPSRPASRAGSVRGTPLVRSVSRDSLSSSISNTSKSSRVKLGITSLSNTQKAARTNTGMGLMTTSKVLEEVLKEKELHIEQLLKEHDLGRTEVAEVTKFNENLQNQVCDLMTAHDKMTKERKSLEDELSSDKRKLEDLQFQLEEETIIKSDLESQMQRQKQIIERLEGFLNDKQDSACLSIKEILKDNKPLTSIIQSEEKSTNYEQEELKTRIIDLENKLKISAEENKKTSEASDTLKLPLKETEDKNANIIASLNTAIQEKDDVNQNLRSELSSQLEKLTTIETENLALRLEMDTQATEAKGHTDNVVREFGEKIKRFEGLSQELMSKCSLLDEMMLEKDSEIESLSKSVEQQKDLLANAKEKTQVLNTSLGQKTTELSEMVLKQNALQEEISALKAKLQNDIGGKEEKILGLIQQIENLTSSVHEKDDVLNHKENTIANLQSKIVELNSSISEVAAKLLKAEETASFASQDSSERITSLQKDIQDLTEGRNIEKIKFEKDLENLRNKCKDLSEDLNSKTSALTEKESSFTLLNESLSEKECESSQIRTELTSIKQLSDELRQEKDEALKSLHDKEQLEIDLRQQLESSEKSVTEKEKLIQLHEEEKQSSELTSNELNRTIESLKSDLQNTILKMEGDNKESSERVSSLKNELSLLTDENTKSKESLENTIKELEEKLKDSTSSVEGKCKEILEIQKDKDALKDAINSKEEEISQLVSKLQLAEQNVEMLNKDSSNHVMSLQNELSKVKEESIHIKASLEKTICTMENQLKESAHILEERDNTLKENRLERDSLEEIIRQKTDENVQLSTKLDLTEKSIQSLDKSSSDQIKALQDELSVLRNDAAVAKDLLEQHLSSFEKHKEETTQIIKEKELAIEEKENNSIQLQNQLKTDADNQSSKVEKLKQEMSDLVKSEKEKYDVLQQQMFNEISRLETDIKHKEEVIEENTRKSNEDSAKLMQLLSDLNHKEDDILSFKKIIEENQNKHIVLQSNLGALNSEVKKQCIEFNQLTESSEKLKDVLQAKEADLFKLEEEKKQMFLELQEKCNKEISDSKVNLLAKDKDIESKEKLIEDLNLKLKNVQSLYDNGLQNSDASLKELAQKCQNLENQNESLLKEKEKIAEDEMKSKNANHSLEQQLQSVIKEKTQNETTLKDKEAKLSELQSEVQRMQASYRDHEQELEQKFKVSEEACATQKCAIEELQQHLHNSEEKYKTLEKELQENASERSEKLELQKRIVELEKANDGQFRKFSEIENENKNLETELKKKQNSIAEKEKEIAMLNETIQALQRKNELVGKVESSLKSERMNANEAANNNSSEPDEEKQSLIMQVDFLNSIIVDMKQKNQELQSQLELQVYDPAADPNLNTPKQIAPRLFCDICDMFDLHDTEDCPKQESYIDDEAAPQLFPQGKRKLEERPYCNNCEVFGHWTLDCTEEETF